MVHATPVTPAGLADCSRFPMEKLLMIFIVNMLDSKSRCEQVCGSAFFRARAGE